MSIEAFLERLKDEITPELGQLALDIGSATLRGEESRAQTLSQCHQWLVEVALKAGKFAKMFDKLGGGASSSSFADSSSVAVAVSSFAAWRLHGRSVVETGGADGLAGQSSRVAQGLCHLPGAFDHGVRQLRATFRGCRVAGAFRGEAEHEASQGGWPLVLYLHQSESRE